MTHQAAIMALNTLQSNFAIIDAIRKSGRGMNKQAIPEMIEWCRKIGYEVRTSSMCQASS
jgi:folylpolyglutamate synthase